MITSTLLKKMDDVKYYVLRTADETDVAYVTKANDGQFEATLLVPVSNPTLKKLKARIGQFLADQ